MLRDQRHRAGFTLVELLIVLAIIALLIAVAFVAFGGARKSASRVETLNALRQMMMGYTSYYGEHKGRLLPGYIKPSMLATGPNQPDKLDLKARLPNGYTLATGDTSPYVWRLAPYLNHAWRTYMADYHSGTLVSRFTNEFRNGDGGGVYGLATYNSGSALPDLGIGIATSIGLNSIFLGGDSYHGPGNVPQYSPWSAANPNVPNPLRIAAVRTSEIMNPAKIVVFAPTKRHFENSPPVTVMSSASDVLGYIELRPPWVPGDDDPSTCAADQWKLEQNRLVPNPIGWTDGAGGLMYDREAVDQVPLAHFDGSTEFRSPIEFMADPDLTGIPRALAIQRLLIYWAPNPMRYNN